MPLTGINQERIITSDAITLSQNYPNPFSFTTVIPFKTNASGNVTLTVYNTQGQEIRRLIDGQLPSGDHSVNFNTFNLQSGIYFYKLSTPNGELTRKMLLNK